MKRCVASTEITELNVMQNLCKKMQSLERAEGKMRNNNTVNGYVFNLN